MDGQNQQERLKNILDTSFDAFVGVDQNGLIIEWNHQAERIFGWSYDEVIGQKMDKLIIPEKLREHHHHGMRRFVESGQATVLNRRIQLEAKRKSGEVFPTEMAITHIQNAGVHEFYSFIQDISDRIAEETNLKFLASHDSLTGLNNRAYFNASLLEAMARCRRNNTNLALLYLDIDHFKSINDKFGHEAGDHLLIEFATRLKNSLREVDIISRIGGDEFTIIVEDVETDQSAIKVANNILNEINREKWLNNIALQIGSSIGIAIYDGIEMSADALVALADKAMYQAKHSGRNKFKLLRFEDVEKSIEIQSKPTGLESINNAKHLIQAPQTSEDMFLQDLLSSVRRHLDMDVAFISHFHDGVREFKVIDSKGLNPPIAVGDSGPLEESYCQRVIDGRLPEIINDAFELPEAMSLPVTASLPVRAHMSVPIRLSNGEIYGTFCCFSYKTNDTLNERDISIMHVFADMVSKHV